MTDSTRLTTAGGHPIADNQNSLTAGARGPLLIQDFQLIEKHAHFNRERIPERVVHAKGSGAYGTFTVTHDITRYSKASLFSTIGKQTELFLRFSTVAGESGAADAERDVRGFAVKFYTDEGNWDVVGNNTPVFFVRDPYKFPDFIHSQKRDPRTNLRDPRRMWDFWSHSPEALHQITILQSDRGLPKTLRHLHGFGSHTFSFVNASGERFWFKIHFKTEQGVVNNTYEEAVKVIGEDRESHQRDLYYAIDRGDFPRWKVKVQVMNEAQAQALPYDPFDLTKVWFYKDFPLIDVGVIELNRNPENYFAEVEQVAFSPANQPPGIGPSPDKMLQFRLFAYADAQRYRLGVNHDSLPVNAPRCPVHNGYRAGTMQTSTAGGTYSQQDNYEPTSFAGPKESPAFREPPLPIDGAADRYNHRIGNDDYDQAGRLFRFFDEGEKSRLMDNIAGTMRGVPEDTVRRALGHFVKADPAYGQGIAQRLGLTL